MKEEIKQAIRDVLHHFDYTCECLGKSFAVADDYTIVCKNCKRRHELKMVKILLKHIQVK